jgi:hypothetical protein
MNIRMKTKLKLITFLLTVTFLSCKNENTIEYKYADNPTALNCSNLNSKLYSEALYSFEDDILNFYGKNKPNPSLYNSYSQFVRNALYGHIKYEEIVSEHTKNVFEALKKESDLWDINSTISHLRYNSDLVGCIAKNIQDENLKTTLNALISTNYMSPKLFGSPLTTKFSNAINDKALASYIAFDLYYAKLFDIDLTITNSEKTETKVDFNKLPKE